MEESENFHTEWAVVNDEGRFSNLGRTWTTLSAAQDHCEWNRLVRRPEMKSMAEDEQKKFDQVGWAAGNQYRRAWQQEESRTYRIVFRRVTDWAVEGE